ncbi:MAG: hypothetical protein AB7N24_20490 [Dehalococcoidia bacterium]
MKHWTRRFATISCVSLLGWALLLPSAPAGSAQSSTTTIFIEGLSIQPGASGTTSILIRTDASTSVTAFSLVVSYDQSLVRPDSIQLDPAWAPAPIAGSSLDSVQLAGTSTDGCQPGNSCRLGQIEWFGLAKGAGTLRIVEATLNEGADDVTFSVTDGTLTVEGATPPSSPPTTVAASPPAASEGLGVNAGLALLFLVALAGAALAAPVVWLVVRLKSFRRRSPRPVAPVARESQDLAVDLTAAVADYLSAYESGAQVNAEADFIYDQMARQAAGFIPPNTPDRLAVDE